MTFFPTAVGEETSEPELTHIPTCPAEALDTCDEQCSDHDSCPDTQLCCRGCGSSCQVPINLPSYSVPLMCPRQTVVLDEDSLTCDIQCQYNDQCPGEKICCYSGCSSSCQYGVPPPNSCTVVRRLLEDDIDEPTSDEEEPPLGEFLPGCHREGFFNPVQVSEANRWCVNVVTGEPIGSAYTASDGLTLTCPSTCPSAYCLFVASLQTSCNIFSLYNLQIVPTMAECSMLDNLSTMSAMAGVLHPPQGLQCYSQYFSSHMSHHQQRMYGDGCGSLHTSSLFGSLRPTSVTWNM